MFLTETLLTRSHQVAFNTGAHYSRFGQRIAAWTYRAADHHADLACFVDFDRQIVGHFPVRMSGQLATATDLARHVLHMYDWGQYSIGLDARTPAMPAVDHALRDVLANGYEAFVTDPEVRRIAVLSRH